MRQVVTRVRRANRKRSALETKFIRTIPVCVQMLVYSVASLLGVEVTVPDDKISFIPDLISEITASTFKGCCRALARLNKMPL